MSAVSIGNWWWLKRLKKERKKRKKRTDSMKDEEQSQVYQLMLKVSVSKEVKRD